jgi:tRNA modification GTPase
MDEETIVALATPPGRAGIAVIRLSGSQSETILAQIFQPWPGKIQARRSTHGYIHEAGRRIDEGLVVFFKAPRSYDGEDMAEISLHSNLFIVEAVLALICKNGARPALPGEFTYRAFRNGKLDLLQAEAVNDLIRANSLNYSLMEFNNLEGQLSKTVAGVRAALLQAAVDIETRIEFAEDQQIETTGAGPALTAAYASLETILASSRFSEILNKGLQVVIAGRVNVGKSSLFNALLMKERSIVSELPGTTRDYIEEMLFLEGFPFHITDVAGIRAMASDDIETQGMRRSQERIAQADAVMFMVDASLPLEESDCEIYRLLESKKRILLANKSDLAQPEVVESIRSAFPGEAVHLLSAKNGENLEAAVDFLKNLLRQLPDASGVTALNLRQRILLEKLHEKIGLIVKQQAQAHSPTELVAEEIRQGLATIGELTGAIGADDILRGVFAKFCIGK